MNRLVAVAEKIYTRLAETFETGVRQAMIAALCFAAVSVPLEESEWFPRAGKRFPLLDEYSLATRLSYFLWSTMPDEELFRHARAGTLRSNLSAQVKRMLADKRANEFVRNFGGQWLQARDIETVQINARAVNSREGIRNRGELDYELRRTCEPRRRGILSTSCATTVTWWNYLRAITHS